MRSTLFIILMISQLTLNAQIITEIMYDPPESGVDSLEYLEIYNNTGADLDLEGYSMIGVTHTFTSATPLAVEQYMLISINAAALSNNFGVNSIQWEGGALNNGGEDIGIINPQGDTIFWMEYSSSGAWPSSAYGAAIELCNLDSDFTEATNWNLAQSTGNFMIDIFFPNGSPGRANEAVCQQRDYKELVINEVLYEQPNWDPDFQYVEFYNYGDKAINLSAWSMRGSLDFPFFGNLEVEPGQYLIMTSKVGSLFPFLQQTPEVVIVFNSSIIGEPDFVLTNPNGDEVMNFRYGQTVEFPIAMRGEAVELCDPTADPNDGNNWAISSNLGTNADGNMLSGTPLALNNCEPSSILELGEADDYSIVPHPVETSFRIESTETYDKLQLIDPYGRIIMEQVAGQDISMKGFAPGTYAVRIFSGARFVTKKLLKL